MSFASLLSENVLIRLLTGRLASYELSVAMVGAKLGERLLLAGCSDAPLLPALAAKTGLTGRTAAVDVDAAAVTAAARAAQRAGTLVDTQVAPFGQLPFADGDFDVSVVRVGGQLEDRAAFGTAIGELYRVLRPGGRIVVIEPARGRNRGEQAGRDTMTDLEGRGYRAAHLLAEREKLVFVGAVKPGTVQAA
jgi:SAM-dependent methyltransferase